MIPMVVLRVKPRDEGALALGVIDVPQEIIEGEVIEIRLPLTRSARGNTDDLRVDVDAEIRPVHTDGMETIVEEPDDNRTLLPRQVIFVPARGTDVVFSVKPDTEQVNPNERRNGTMNLVLTVTVSYREGHRTVRKTQIQHITINLKSDRVIRRISPGLGNILGMMPKSMRG